MVYVENFRLTDVPIHKIALAATSDVDYEMNRVLLLEDTPKIGDFLIVQGYHCSCYDFNETKWDATQYTADEIRKLAASWIEHGWGAEKIIAPLILAYVRA